MKSQIKIFKLFIFHSRKVKLLQRITDIMIFFVSNEKEDGLLYSEQNPEDVILMGEYINDSFEFINEGFRYLDRIPSFRFIDSVAYAGIGTGNYEVTATVTDYLIPLKFSVEPGTVKRVYMSSMFGHRQTSDPTIYSSGGDHNGIDFAIPTGTPIVAVMGGVVSISTYHAKAGYYINILHPNGYTSRYLHNSTLLVQQGEEVTAGAVIALSGNSGRSTGPHLHFEIRDEDYEAIDPMPYLPLERTEE